MKKLTLEEGYWQSGFTGKGQKKYSSRWHRDEKIRNYFFIHLWITLLANVARVGQVILWNNGQEQEKDEVIGPAFEDYFLYNNIKKKGARLFDYIQ